MAIQPMSSRFYILLAFATLPLSAQWLNHIPAGTPMKHGKPNLSAPSPRATNGKPDLTGVWMHETFSLEQMKKFYGPAADEEANIGMEIFTVHKYGLNALLDAKPGEQVMTAAGQAAFKQRQQSRNLKDVCHNRYGWPVLSLLSEPFKIVQAPKETMIVYEIDNQHRQVFTDGRKFPAEFEFPARLGYSIGRWEGDTFVVETRGFNDDTPIDGMGHPRSEDMHVTERYHRRDFGHLETEITWDDSKYYIRPITVKINYIGTRGRQHDVRQQRQPQRSLATRRDRQVERVALARSRAYVLERAGTRVERGLVDAREQHIRRLLKISAVPLPWCTSQSRTKTRRAPSSAIAN